MKARLTTMALARVLQQDGTTKRMPTAIPFSQLATVVEQLHADNPDISSHRTLRRSMQHEIDSVGNQDTPYGKLVQHLDFGLQEGPIPFINPFALIHLLSHISLTFGNLLRRPACTASLVFSRTKPFQGTSCALTPAAA